MIDKIKVITLCGSMKYIKSFRESEVILTRQGSVVLSPIFGEDVNITENDIKLFGEHHLRKIDLSDEIFVIDVDKYIGDSTRKEIEYAVISGKKVRYYSEEIVI